MCFPPSLRDITLHSITQRNAPQCRRHVTGTCRLAANAEKYLPRTLALPTFFRDVFVERKTLAVRTALRYVAESVGPTY